MRLLQQEIIGALILFVLFLATIGLIEWLTRKHILASEHARKAVHVFGGLGCLLFPFMVYSWVTVLCLASLFSVLLYVGEKKKYLHALSGVGRKSYGSMLFPVAVVFLYLISAGRLWLYISALLVLVLADTAAALAGTRFGTTFFKTGPGERKSFEGTLAFFVAGFLAVFIPMHILSHFTMTVCLLTAFLTSLLLSGFEAVAIGGTDNILVPLATCFLLQVVPIRPQLEILFQCVSLLSIAAFIYLANYRFKTLEIRSLIIFVIYSYAAWSLGAAEWLIPVLVGFVMYNRMCKCRPRFADGLSSRELLRPLYPSIAILFTANTWFIFNFWFGPFIVAVVIATSLCIVNRWRIEPKAQILAGKHLFLTVILPCVAILLLCMPFQGALVWPVMAVMLPLCGLVVLLYNRYALIPVTPFSWNWAIPLNAAFAAVLYAGIQYAELVPLMESSTWMEVFR